MVTVEEMAADVRKKFNIRSIHIFNEGDFWRAFGARGDDKFKQSVGEGRGTNVFEALVDLRSRLEMGPIQSSLTPWTLP